MPGAEIIGGTQAADAIQRAGILARAQGIFAETAPRWAMSAGSILLDGAVNYAAVALLAGDVITNLNTVVTTGGVALTLSKLGVYDKLGNRLALSADQGAAWQATGMMTAAMLAPYAVLTSDLYYFAVVSKGGVLPTMLRNAVSGVTAALSVIGSKPPPLSAQAGQTDLPATGTIVAGSATAFGVWIGAS